MVAPNAIINVFSLKVFFFLLNPKSGCVVDLYEVFRSKTLDLLTPITWEPGTFGGNMWTGVLDCRPTKDEEISGSQQYLMFLLLIVDLYL